MEKNAKQNGHEARRATTAQILGGIIKPAPIDPRWQQHYEMLVELRENLARRKDALSETARQQEIVFSLHMADAGTDEFDRDFALSMASSDQNALYEIDEALDRLRRGRYGICEISGEPIELERLQAIPWTRYSAAAQRELEMNGGFVSAKLAPRRSVSEPADTRDEPEELAA